MNLNYLVNMIDGEQYEISQGDYDTLRGWLSEDRLGGIYIVRPDASETIILTVRNIVSLGVEAVEENDE